MNKDILLDLIAAREFRAVRSIMNVMNAVDIASLLSELSDKELAVVFRLIPKEKAAYVFSEMGHSAQSILVEMFTDTELQWILDNLYMDDTVDLLEDLPANLVSRILETVQPEKRAQINKLLNYPEDSAGSIMTMEYVDLRRQTTVAQALAHIKAVGIHKETIYTCYILDERKLAGIVTAKDLLTADDGKTMEELMETEIISVSTHTDQEEVANLFKKYNFLAIPVLDADQRMVGIVTVDDALDVMVDEVTEDMSIMGAITPHDETYFETSVWEHAKHRIPWLFFLMLSASITGVIISKYEEAFTVIPLLVSFIPMLMDTGGNCGSQSSTLVIRGLALDEIHFSQLFKVIFKEFRIALIVGLVLSVTNGARIFIMYRSLPIALVVAGSLAATIVLSKMIGCTLPLLAQKIRLDPAVMAAPLITTVVDTCSIIIYFNIATSILPI